jgi:glycolate oxidase FAD binding subunit
VTLTTQRDLARHAVDPITGAPPAELTVAPTKVDELASILSFASANRLRVLIWGGGSHQGFGYRVDPDVVLSTRRLEGVVAWEPDDLTVVVAAGTRVDHLEHVLSERGQSAVLLEDEGPATVGGVVAAGQSGWRRARYGPVRDRLLEVTLVTGDGRVVRAGGRVVKNVTGFDLCRLAAGSFGRLGVIVEVCLKLWPHGRAAATVQVDRAEDALAKAYRPLAVIEQDGSTTCYLQGTQGEVDSQAAALGGAARPGLEWPRRLSTAITWSLRVPPASTRAAVERVPSGWRYQAQFGVGEIILGSERSGVEEAGDLREWAESLGGAMVLSNGPASLYDEIDPWGTPPPAADVQRRLVERFDPEGVLNPGRLPGRL